MPLFSQGSSVEDARHLGHTIIRPCGGLPATEYVAEGPSPRDLRVLEPHLSGKNRTRPERRGSRGPAVIRFFSISAKPTVFPADSARSGAWAYRPPPPARAHEFNGPSPPDLPANKVIAPAAFTPRGAEEQNNVVLQSQLPHQCEGAGWAVVHAAFSPLLHTTWSRLASTMFEKPRAAAQTPRPAERSPGLALTTGARSSSRARHSVIRFCISHRIDRRLRGAAVSQAPQAGPCGTSTPVSAQGSCRTRPFLTVGPADILFGPMEPENHFSYGGGKQHRPRLVPTSKTHYTNSWRPRNL